MEGSLLTYLQEEADMGAENGGKLRASILKGASSTCMAGVRAMALICESVFWQMIRAVKPSAEKHVLDVLPCVWPAAHTFFERAAAAPAGVVDGSLCMELGLEAAPAPATASQASRAARAAIDMARIRRAAAGDAIVERLLAAAFDAMAKATANHASEWLPAGLIATDGSTTVEGKLCTVRITPELRAKYDALCATSTPVERLHALGRCVDDRGKRQRVDTRAGVQLGIFNGQAEYLAALEVEQLALTLDVCRPAARKVRRETIKQQLISAGRAKQAVRNAKLSSKRARREAKAAERAHLEKVVMATRYSQLVTMPISGEGSLQEQLKAFKLSGKTGFTITQKNRAAYCAQLQKLIFDVHSTEANDLDDGDAGCGGERVVRKRQLGSSAVGGKRKLIDAAGIEYTADEKFEIEQVSLSKPLTPAAHRTQPSYHWTHVVGPDLYIIWDPTCCAQLLDRKMVEWKVRGKKKDYPMYLVLWKGYPPESASWQYPTERKGDGGIPLEMVDEYEAALEAEAELEAEEEAEDEEDSMEDD